MWSIHKEISLSSRNAFTSNYIYDGDVTEDLCIALEKLGWGVRTSGSNGANQLTQVVGMIKNVDYFKNELEAKLKKILTEVREKHDYYDDLSLVFIGDEHPVVTFITTSDKNHVFNV
jgi:hypothetical protein